MTATEPVPDPDDDRLPARLDALFPDVIDLLTETAAAERVRTRHTTEPPDESERS